MSCTEFTVNEKALGKPRPRVTKNGVYIPKKYKDLEKKIAVAYVEAGGKLHTNKVILTIGIHNKLPKSAPKKIISEPNTYKPDIDNILKTIMDGLNGVAYIDDKQVVDVHIVKLPRTRDTEDYINISVFGSD